MDVVTSCRSSILNTAASYDIDTTDDRYKPVTVPEAAEGVDIRNGDPRQGRKDDDSVRDSEITTAICHLCLIEIEESRRSLFSSRMTNGDALTAWRTQPEEHVQSVRFEIVR